MSIKEIKEKVEELEKLKLKREIPKKREEIDKDGVLVFCSNDYLGLSEDERVIKEMLNTLERKKRAGATASRIVCGNFEEYEEFEEKMKDILGGEILVLNSGWCANVGVISALGDENTEIFSDELNHASIIDGCRLSKSKVSVYKNCDLNHLEHLLKKSQARKKIIITESVFSMDGFISDLKEIEFLSQKYSSLLYVDEAHAFGVLGYKGKGVSWGNNVSHETFPDITLFTLSKAVGTFGAFIRVKEKFMKDFIISRVRSFIFATALSPHILKGALKSIEIIISNEGDMLRKKLFSNSQYLQNIIGITEIPPGKIKAPHILPIIIGDNEKVLYLRDKLYENGFFVQAIRPPSVPPGTARLRVTSNAKYKKNDIEKFSKALLSIIKKEIIEGKCKERR